jgi:hypothetical protein
LTWPRSPVAAAVDAVAVVLRWVLLELGPAVLELAADPFPTDDAWPAALTPLSVTPTSKQGSFGFSCTRDVRPACFRQTDASTFPQHQLFV